MDRKQLQHQVASMRRSFFDQGYLEAEQFLQLEDLQDETNPNFVEEIVTLFYDDSAKLLNNVEVALMNRPLDFNKLDDLMHQFKGSSSSIGATKVKNESQLFREYCKFRNGEGCCRAFQQLKQEHKELQAKLASYFQLIHQAGVSNGRGS